MIASKKWSARMAILTLSVGIAPLALCCSAQAQTMPDHETCLSGQVVLPDALKGWASPVTMTAAANTAALENTVLKPGQAAQLTLQHTGEMQYALRPAEPGGKVSSGGMVAFEAPTAGTYRVMMNVRAWLDVVHDGKAVDSVHHQHGPACSGIGKMVDFPLPAGRSVIQLSGSGKPVAEIMVVPVP